MRVFCDLQRPVPGIPGEEWARVIEATADRFLGVCVDLDPNRDLNRDVNRNAERDVNRNVEGDVSGGVMESMRAAG